MNNEEKTNGYLLPVFVLTRTGVNLNDAGTKIVRNMVLGNDEMFSEERRAEIKSELPENTTNAIIHTGEYLLKAGDLADLLEKTPNARVVISFGDSFSTLPYHNGKGGLPAIVENLRYAAEHGIDSWTIINETAHNAQYKG